MYLVIFADKDSYDRDINISLDDTFSSKEMASDELKKILLSWLLIEEPKDEELYKKVDYNDGEYRTRIKKRIKTRITKAINKNEGFIEYNSYDSFTMACDSNGNIEMISTGCPSDNEYCGETYQVIYI